jgi:hypothetical protein
MAGGGGEASQGDDGVPIEEGAPRPETLLGAQLLTGEQLLQSARMVGDQQDVTVWQVNRENWIDSTAAVLGESFPDSADDFRIACHATVRGHWRAVFEAEARAVEEGLRLISSLLGTFGSGS